MTKHTHNTVETQHHVSNHHKLPIHHHKSKKNARRKWVIVMAVAVFGAGVAEHLLTHTFTFASITEFFVLGFWSFVERGGGSPPEG